ncbi:MAG TPA: hypothetical protein VF530_21215 [Planctomycetota bacterium]
MRSSSLAGVVALLLIAAAAPTHGQRARGGRLYELVPLEAGTSTRATDVNARGQACGLVTEPSGTVALRWSTAAGLTPLAPVPGYPRALALGITRDGFVLGQSFSPSLSVATLWSPSGTPTALPSLGWSLVEPAAISDAGVVVGRGYAGGPWQPWVWDAVHGTRLLASLGFPAGATVTDVDANGVLAGAPSFGEAFLFDLATATVTPLGTLGGDTSAALALDEAGYVVGRSQTLPANEPAPFFWTPFGGMRSLGTPSGPGDVDGQAHDVNRHAVVVGAFESAPGETHAFVWEETLGLRDLNALVRARGGVELQSALHLSDSGWIAGIGKDHSQGGKTVGFLLRPL